MRASGLHHAGLAAGGPPDHEVLLAHGGVRHLTRRHRIGIDQLDPQGDSK